MTFTRRITIGMLLALVGATAVPGAARAAEIARPARATPVDANHGLVVWSAYDRQAGGFRLVLRNSAGRARTLSTAVSPVPFDADIGDDAQRRRVVVYASCPSGPESCDVRMVRVADDRDDRVAVAARAGRAEHAPTVSRGRLAWVVGGGLRERPQVWLHELGSPAPPVAVPALPRRRCGEHHDGGRRCEPVFGSIGELELRGNTLAQAAFTTTSFLRTGELRLVDVKRRTSQRLFSFGNGESGQGLIGTSIEADHVYAYKTCFGDPSGCGSRAGTFRYGLRTGRLEIAESSRQLSGFSVDRGRVLVSEGSERLLCELEQGGYPGVPGAKLGPCPVEERPLPRTWAPVVTRP